MLRQSSDVARLKARWTLADQSGQQVGGSSSNNTDNTTSFMANSHAANSSATRSDASGEDSKAAASTMNQGTPQGNMQIGGVLDLDMTPPNNIGVTAVNPRSNTRGKRYTGITASALGGEIAAERSVPLGRLLEQTGPALPSRGVPQSSICASLPCNYETRKLTVGGSGIDGGTPSDGGYEDHMLGEESPNDCAGILGGGAGRREGLDGSAAGHERSYGRWEGFGQRLVSSYYQGTEEIW